ncbi:AtpZ/AtpI family protein [Paenibacillus guangzhouensis]|uniref:AtpZ/AtpI family protein n=1 Tax=Paenibacillus guangzhouensis TaxID=1473112 RepID=UPI0012670590|nr:AtpZ/AtpI family protein [Paenibacillus guangzhouensis]
MTTSKNGGTPWRAMGLVTLLGLDLAVCTLVGYFAGKWIGEKVGSVPLCTAAGVLLGVLIGVSNVIVLIKKVLEDSNG